MPSETAPQESKSDFEQGIVETIDSGYTGSITKQMGREKVTLAEMAELLGEKAPSASLIGDLLTKDYSELGEFARTSDPSELANSTIFLGTKYVNKKGEVWFKTFVPKEQYSGRKSHHVYNSADTESKYYGIAMPVEEDK